MDQAAYDFAFSERIRNINIVIDEAKKENKESILFPYFIPELRHKQFDGFKGELIETLKGEGLHVTNFLPGSRPSFRGTIRDIYICWTDDARKAVEGMEGYEFR